MFPGSQKGYCVSTLVEEVLSLAKLGGRRELTRLWGIQLLWFGFVSLCSSLSLLCLRLQLLEFGCSNMLGTLLLKAPA